MLTMSSAIWRDVRDGVGGVTVVISRPSEVLLRVACVEDDVKLFAPAIEVVI